MWFSSVIERDRVISSKIVKIVAYFGKREINIKPRLASLKTLTNSAKCVPKAHQFLFPEFLGRFSSVHMEQFSGSQAAFGITFRKQPEQGF
jgi:hypothetical protein